MKQRFRQAFKFTKADWLIMARNALVIWTVAALATDTPGSYCLATIGVAVALGVFDCFIVHAIRRQAVGEVLGTFESIVDDAWAELAAKR